MVLLTLYSESSCAQLDIEAELWPHLTATGSRSHKLGIAAQKWPKPPIKTTPELPHPRAHYTIHRTGLAYK